MKLKAADIDRIMEQNVPKPAQCLSAQDYYDSNASHKDALITSLTSHKTNSTARRGEALPLPPKNLHSLVTDHKDTSKPHKDDRSDLLEHGVATQAIPMHPHPSLPTIAPNAHPFLHLTAEGKQQLLLLQQQSEEGAPGQDQDQDSPTISGELGEEVFQPILPLALRNCDLNTIKSRADLIYALTQNLPMNEIGLPKILYRADLLDWKLFSGASSLDDDPAATAERYQQMQDYLDAATIHLSYSEGFPALPTGEALWAKLPFEVQEHYEAFTAYCTLTGMRQTASIISHPQTDILQWFHEDYWSIRVKCYDMLQHAHAAKKREQRILACDDNTYLQAENVLKRLISIGADVKWDLLQEEPEKYVAVMERAFKLQRQALGLLSANGNGPSGSKSERVETIEATMKRIAEPKELKVRDDEGIDVRQLLRSPEALSSAQELIIRMTQTTRTEQQYRDDTDSN